MSGIDSWSRLSVSFSMEKILRCVSNIDQYLARFEKLEIDR